VAKFGTLDKMSQIINIDKFNFEYSAIVSNLTSSTLTRHEKNRILRRNALKIARTQNHEIINLSDDEIIGIIKVLNKKIELDQVEEDAKLLQDKVKSKKFDLEDVCIKLGRYEELKSYTNLYKLFGSCLTNLDSLNNKLKENNLNNFKINLVYTYNNKLIFPEPNHFSSSKFKNLGTRSDSLNQLINDINNIIKYGVQKIKRDLEAHFMVIAKNGVKQAKVQFLKSGIHFDDHPELSINLEISKNFWVRIIEMEGLKVSDISDKFSAIKW